MQLVQPSKVFSVTIFRTCSIGMRTCELGYVSIFSSTEKFWELHALFSERVYKPLTWGRGLEKVLLG